MSIQKKTLSKKAKVGISLGCVLPVVAATGAVVAVTIVDGNLITPKKKKVDGIDGLATFTFKFREQPLNNKTTIRIASSTGDIDPIFNETNDDTITVNVIEKSATVVFKEDKVISKDGKSLFSLDFSYQNTQGNIETQVTGLEIDWQPVEHTLTLLSPSLPSEIVCVENYAKTISDFGGFSVILDKNTSKEQDVTNDAEFSNSLESSGVVVDKDSIIIHENDLDAGIYMCKISASVEGFSVSAPLVTSFNVYGTKVSGGTVNLTSFEITKNGIDQHAWNLIVNNKSGDEHVIVNADVSISPTFEGITIDKTSHLVSWSECKPGDYEFRVSASGDYKSVHFSDNSQPINLHIATPTVEGINEIYAIKNQEGTCACDWKLKLDGQEQSSGVTYEINTKSAESIALNNNTISWGKLTENATFTLKLSYGIYSAITDPITIDVHELTVVGGHEILEYGNESDSLAWSLNDDGQSISAELDVVDSQKENANEVSGFHIDNGIISWDENVIEDDQSKTIYVKAVSKEGPTAGMSFYSNPITITRNDPNLMGPQAVSAQVGIASTEEAPKYTFAEGCSFEITESQDVEIDNDGQLSWDALSEGEYTFTVIATRGYYSDSLDCTLTVRNATLTCPENPLYLLTSSGETATGLFSFTVPGCEVSNVQFSTNVTGYTIDSQGKLTYPEATNAGKVTLTITGKWKDETGFEYSDSKDFDIYRFATKIAGTSQISLTKEQATLSTEFALQIDDGSGFVEVNSTPDESKLPNGWHLQKIGTTNKFKLVLDTTHATDGIESIQVGATYEGFTAWQTISVEWIDASIIGNATTIYGQTGVEGWTTNAYQLHYDDTTVAVANANYSLSEQESYISLEGGKIKWSNEGTQTAEAGEKFNLTIEEKDTHYIKTQELTLHLRKAELTGPQTIKGIKGEQGVADEAIIFKLNGQAISPVWSFEGTHAGIDINTDGKLKWDETAQSGSYTVVATYEPLGEIQYKAKFTTNLQLEDYAISGDNSFDVNVTQGGKAGEFNLTLGGETQTTSLSDWSVEEQTSNANTFEVGYDSSNKYYYITWTTKLSYGSPYVLNLKYSKDDIEVTKEVTINAHELIITGPNTIYAPYASSGEVQFNYEFDGEHTIPEGAILMWSMQTADPSIKHDSHGKIYWEAEKTINCDAKIIASLTIPGSGVAMSYEKQFHIATGTFSITGVDQSISLEPTRTQKYTSDTLQLTFTPADGSAAVNIPDCHDNFAWELDDEYEGISINSNYQLEIDTTVDTNTDISIVATKKQGKDPGVLIDSASIDVSISIEQTLKYEIHMATSGYGIAGGVGQLADELYVTCNGEVVQDPNINWEIANADREDHHLTLSPVAQKATLGWNLPANAPPGKFCTCHIRAHQGEWSVETTNVFRLDVVDPSSVIQVHGQSLTPSVKDGEDGTFALEFKYKEGVEGLEPIDLGLDETSEGIGLDISYNHTDDWEQLIVSYQDGSFSAEGSEYVGRAWIEFKYFDSIIRYDILFKVSITH